MLASTLHDRENRLSGLIEETHRRLGSLFESIVVAVTPETHPEIRLTLSRLDSLEVCTGGASISSTYRTALEQSLAKNPERILYCDFDRVIHWARVYPEELERNVNSYPQHDFLLIGRTPSALCSHPETQITTEAIANSVASRVLGFKETRDVISACWRLTPELTEKLLQLPERNTYGFYCEWPIVAWRQARRPEYIEVEGLEWETPDRYMREVEEKGYEQWLRGFQTPEEWRKRVKILADVIQSMTDYIPR